MLLRHFKFYVKMLPFGALVFQLFLATDPQIMS